MHTLPLEALQQELDHRCTKGPGRCVVPLGRLLGRERGRRGTSSAGPHEPCLIWWPRTPANVSGLYFSVQASI